MASKKSGRNPIAAALRSPHLQQKVVPDKKTVYSRKGRQSQDWRLSSYWGAIIMVRGFSLCYTRAYENTHQAGRA